MEVIAISAKRLSEDTVVQPVLQSPLELQLLMLLRVLQPLLVLHSSLRSFQVSLLDSTERLADALRRCLLFLHCDDLGLKASNLVLDVIPDGQLKSC